MSSPPNDDAQRDMEQRALRNVRGLVDKIELREQLNIQLGSIDDMGGAH